jgi:NADPH2:quinone reductase
MRVIQAMRFGDPEVLVAADTPDPRAGPGEMVVDVAVAEVIFLDTQLRAGWGREHFSVEPPFVPGVGVAGIVSSVGEGVDEIWIGRAVIASTSTAGEYNGGGYAERAAVDARAVYAVPDGVELREAITALHDGLMAVSRFERAEIGSGTRVLVTAAGGSLGTWLIPLAARAGARVIAAARGERKLALARELGAHLAVDYSEADWAERVRADVAGEGLDVVFDGAGGPIGAEAFELTGRGGRFFSYGAASGDFPDIEAEARRRGVRVTGIGEQMSTLEQRRLVEAALARLAAREIRPVIGQAVPLEHAAEAHAAIANRSVPGKTLLLAGS